MTELSQRFPFLYNKMNVNTLKNLCLYSIFWILIQSGAMAAFAIDIKNIQSTLGLDHSELDQLKNGEIVSFPVSEETDKELAVGLAVFLNAPPSKLTHFFQENDFSRVDPDVVLYHENAAEQDLTSFREFKFIPDQIEEVKHLLSVNAGHRFNLSDNEIKGLNGLKEKVRGLPDNHVIEAVSHHYQGILFNRLTEYRKAGLKGIAPYSRKKRSAHPADELNIAATSSKLLKSFYPRLQAIWINYPYSPFSDMQERFTWINRQINDRPTAILSHRLIFSSTNESLILSRQFFVGHTYNSSQLIIGCLPYQNGSLVFYTHRTSTDRVAGAGKHFKHKIGREQMKQQMMINLHNLRSAVQK